VAAWVRGRVRAARRISRRVKIRFNRLQKHAGAGQCERVERAARAARRGARAGAGTVLTMPMPRLLSSIDERERGDAHEQTVRRVRQWEGWEGWRASVGLWFVWLRDAPDDPIAVTAAELRASTSTSEGWHSRAWAGMPAFERGVERTEVCIRDTPSYGTRCSRRTSKRSLSERGDTRQLNVLIFLSFGLFSSD